jgi:hypothetical protein
MKDRKDDNNPVSIALPGNTTEVIIPNTVVLHAEYNSPYNVTIDGHGRVLKIQDQGVLITVDNGITLTLLNITLEGKNANTTPLARVKSGGKLILGDGAVLTGNKTTGFAGGVWVDGGELIMNSGSVIKRMEVTNDLQQEFGGGVLIANNGNFVMLGGTIGGTDPGDGNIVNNSYASFGGGGVMIAQGSFVMYNGTIRGNRVNYGGGGVYSPWDGKYFSHYGGSLTDNVPASASY